MLTERLEAVQSSWLEHALGGDDSLDQERAVCALGQLYRLVKLPEPDYVVILDSPLAAALAFEGVRLFSEPLSNVWPPETPALTQTLNRAVNALVRIPISRRGGGSPHFADRLWDQLEERVPWLRGLRGQRRPYSLFSPPPTGFTGLGCGNPGWLAHGELLRAQEQAHLLWSAVHEMALAGVWDCILTARCAVLVRRPTRVARDDLGRLHSTSGPAFACSDGFEGFCIHGVAVPAWVVTQPERLTLSYLWEATNLELRRVLIDKFGRQRFLELSRASVVDHDRDGGGMERRLLRLPGEARYVEVRCPSTGNTHILCVPPTVTSCHEAVAWTFNKVPNEYAPVREATHPTPYFRLWPSWRRPPAAARPGPTRCR